MSDIQLLNLDLNHIITKDAVILSEKDRISRSIELFRSYGNLGKHESSILVQLFLHPHLSGKELSKELHVPDSKIYPALTNLIELGMIRAEGTRPARYLANTTEEIIDVLITAEKTRLDQFKLAMTELEEHLEEIYTEEPRETQVAHILKDNVQLELGKFIKQTKQEIELILSEEVIHILSVQYLRKLIIRLLTKAIQVKLALPRKYQDIVLDQSNPENVEFINDMVNKEQLQIKHSILCNTAYIIRDSKMAAHVFNHPIQSFALITNDTDFLSLVGQCWIDGSGCLSSISCS
ncbi:MAG: hypothetical protein INQ03_21745 [Candidatus Heimdallarchaeota archaeon]|nr:hypothetical protein [Candidatus Heimdallarchaeota archaeon]